MSLEECKMLTTIIENAYGRLMMSCDVCMLSNDFNYQRIFFWF